MLGWVCVKFGHKVPVKRVSGDTRSTMAGKWDFRVPMCYCGVSMDENLGIRYPWNACPETHDLLWRLGRWRKQSFPVRRQSQMGRGSDSAAEGTGVPSPASITMGRGSDSAQLKETGVSQRRQSRMGRGSDSAQLKETGVSQRRQSRCNDNVAIMVV